ncbi:hypothetical protein C8R45DRAFT_1082940 [Mycena sanguinolenta]|nr:hypothetical protein C8R45DRAFT_1082940 [Mycena sanguinolenta]
MICEPLRPTAADNLLALAQALSDAQTAVAEIQPKFAALQAKVLELQKLTAQQAQEILVLRARSDAFAEERDSERDSTASKARIIDSFQQRLDCMEASRISERKSLDDEHGELARLREALEAKEGALKAKEAELKADKGRLTREKNKFSKEQQAARSAVAGLERTVEDLKSQLGNQDKFEEGGDDGPPRKRRTRAS